MRRVSLGVLIAALAAPVTLATPASAATGSISGTVRNHSGGTLAEVGVQVRSAATGTVVANGTSAANGTYSVGGLSDGSYLVLFQPGGASAGYSWQYWNDKMDVASADRVSVAGGAPTTGIDPVLDAAGAISGHVSDSAGKPAAGVCVATVPAYGEAPHSATSDASGAYTIINVQPGSYNVEFGDCTDSPYVRRSYPSSVSVSPAQTTSGVDGTVQRYGSISGVVTKPDGSPWPVFCFGASPTNYDPQTDNVGGTGSSQNTDGSYTLSRIAPGTYRVMFTSCGPAYPSSDPAAEYYSASGDPTKPTDVTVGDGQQVTGVSMAVPRGARISGTVTDRAGNPLPTAAVGAWAPITPPPGDDASATWQFPEVWTDSNGHFTIGGLPTGHYQLSYRLNGSPDIAVWYHDAVRKSDGTVIAAHVGQDIAGIDQILRTGGGLHGHVAGPNGAPVANATVTAYPLPNGSGYPTIAPVTVTTGSDGSWAFDDIAAGPWAVSATPPDTTVAPRWYPSVADRGEAQPVSVPYNGTSADATITLATASTITGHVTDPTGQPLSNACVDVRDPEHQHSIGAQTTVQTDSNGSYRAGGLNPGSYLIHLRPCGAGTYGSTFHDGHDLPADSPQVTVGAGTTADAGTDALPAGGDITGVVTDTNGRMCCNVLATGPSGAKIAGTRALDGSYRLSGLRAGNWTVHFQACIGLQPEFYNRAQNPQDATPVTVTSGNVTSDISATMQPEPSTETSACTDGPGVGNLTATPVNATTVHVAWTLPPEVGRPRGGNDIAVFDPQAGKYLEAASFTVPDGDTATTVAGLPTNHQYRIDVTTRYQQVPSNYHAMQSVDVTLGTPASSSPPPGTTPSPTPTSAATPTSSGSSPPPADSTAPTIVISTRPAAMSRVNTATIGFSVSDPDNDPSALRTTCTLDQGLPTTCTSPASYQQLADGSHTLTVSAVDPAGNRRTQTVTWLVDTTRPKASVTWPSSTFTTPGTKTLRWSGTDTGSGLATYDVRWYSNDGAARRTWHYPSSWQHTSARSTTAKLQPRLTYCFAVNTRDRAGNSSGWTTPRCVATAVDDRAVHTAGRWRHTSATGAYRSTLSTATSRGAALSLTTHNATKAAVTAVVCPSCGVIGFFEDSRLIRKVSLVASRTALRAFAFNTARRSSATLTWRVLSSGRRVTIDAVAAYTP